MSGVIPAVIERAGFIIREPLTPWGRAEGTRGDTGITPRSELAGAQRRGWQEGGVSGDTAQAGAVTRYQTGRVLVPCHPAVQWLQLLLLRNPAVPSVSGEKGVIFSSVYLSCMSWPGKSTFPLQGILPPSLQDPFGPPWCCSGL